MYIINFVVHMPQKKKSEYIIYPVYSTSDIVLEDIQINTAKIC